MIDFETWGDNDFASVFPSVREEQRAAAEKEQAQLLLRLLDEMETRQEQERRVEYLRINGRGDVVREEQDGDKRGRIMTVDQLPRESEYEMLFGKQEPVEPQVLVETGLRLRDGKEVQALSLAEPRVTLFQWSGVRFETLALVVALIFIVLLLWIRSSRRRRRQQLSQAFIEHEVERRVQMRLLSMNTN